MPDLRIYFQLLHWTSAVSKQWYIHLCCLYRENFDLAMNTIKLYVHFSQEYVFANGALQRMTVSN